MRIPCLRPDERGRCVLAADELRIESNVVAHVRRYWEGNRALLAGYLGVYAALVAAVRVVRGENWDALLFGAGVVAAWWSRGVLNDRHGITSDGTIPLENVESVAAVEADDWLTRPRFVVRYWRGGVERERRLGDDRRRQSRGPREKPTATRRDSGEII